MAATTDLTILTSVERTHGVTTRSRLRALGLTDKQVDDRLRRGFLVARHRSVYAVVGFLESFEQQVLAAQLAATPRAAASHWTAGRLHGIRGMGRSTDVHLMVPDTRRRRLHGVVVHHTDTLRPFDVAKREDGIRVLRPFRWLFSMAEVLDESGFHDAFEDARNKGLVSVAGARAFWRGLHERGRNGSALFGDYAFRDDLGARPTQSRNEIRLLRELRARGLHVVQQHPVDLRSGERVYLDLATVDSRIDVECDHRATHGHEERRQADLRRDAQLSALGWLPMRFDNTRLGTELDACVDEVVLAHHARIRRTA